MTNFVNRPRLDFSDDGQLVLVEALIYCGNSQEFVVPAGTETDLASFPWLFGWLLNKLDRTHALAAILHDWLYRTHPIGVCRKDADRLFLRVMIEEGAPAWRSYLMFAAVRLFGGKAWRAKA